MAQSSAVTRAYAEVQEMLGVEFVPTVYRKLAPYEPWLSAALRSLGPFVTSPEAQVQTASLSRRAGAVATPPRVTLPAEQASGAAELVGRFGLANPRTLLFLAASTPVREREWTVMATAFPPGAPSREEALEEIRLAHHRIVPGFWRELAGFPSAFDAAWRQVRSLAGTTSWLEGCRELLDLATRATEGFSAPSPRDLLGDDAVHVESILRDFCQILPATIVEIETTRALIRG